MKVSNCICGRKISVLEARGKFFIECPKCGKRTRHYVDERTAVHEWENMRNLDTIDDTTFKEV